MGYFNENLKALRINKGVTQQVVADYLGVDVTTYAHYESGKRSPNYEKLRQIAMFYGLDDELLGVKGDTNRKEMELLYRYVTSLMNNMNLTKKKAMDALDIPKDKQNQLEEYILLLQNGDMKEVSFLFNK